jgi:secondary thiamine-phosphate synthase enzyme
MSNMKWHFSRYNPTVFRKTLTVRAPAKGLHMITADVARLVEESGVQEGMCHLFLQHTSAGLIIQENYDPDVRTDLENFFDKLAPQGKYLHSLEGPDDMPSHIKSVLNNVSLSIPVQDGKLSMGTWQGIYLWEHREKPEPRHVVVSVVS